MEDIVPLVICIFIFTLMVVLLFNFIEGYAGRASLVRNYDSAVMRCLYLSEGIDTGNGNSSIAASMPTKDGRVVCRG